MSSGSSISKVGGKKKTQKSSEDINVTFFGNLCADVPTPPVLVKAEATPPVKDAPPVKKAVPHKFPLLERVKGKTSEQLKALEESFQRSSSPSESELGMNS